MKEIIEVNKRLREKVGKRFAKDWLMFNRRSKPSELKELPEELRVEIEALDSKLAQALPDDVSYTLFLGEEEPTLQIDYEDGPQVGTFGMGPEFDATRSIFEQLQEYDWDAYRAKMLPLCQMFGGMVDAVKDLPSELPSTKQLQRKFRAKMKAFVKEKRGDVTKVHVLTFREDNGLNDECGLMEETYPNLEAFARDLYNLMTVQLWIITVVADGKPLPIEKIDSFKKQALKELEGMPISRAKALGKL